MLVCLLCGVPVEAKKIVPAFPGAEGFGRYVSGGRGGKVYHVTSLEDDPNNVKPGTFRYAVNQNGARTIVFDVAGTIHLKSSLRISDGNVTIAGQTSPGGICIADYPFSIGAQNVIVRYLRIRPGDVCGTECDGFGGFDGGNFIIDHCSVSWSVDEVISVYSNENTTVQWCIASQPLNYSVHPKTKWADGKPHGYGGVWGGDHATFHHNLIAHATSRTPRFGSRYTMAERGLTDLTDCRNNVFYNWSGVGCYGGSNMQINMVNNYIKPGPATDAVYGNNAVRHGRIFAADSDVLGIYATGNYVDGHADITKDNWPNGIWAQMDATEAQKKAARKDVPYEDGNIVTFTAQEAYNQVIDYVGACNYRDRLDSVIVTDTRDRKASFTSYTQPYHYQGKDYDGKTTYTIDREGGWLNPGCINTQNDVIIDGEDSPWVNIPTDNSRNMKDTDGDGIPDEWEYRMDMDPTDPQDALETDSIGYTMLEVYMNKLVEKITSAPYGEREVPGTRPEDDGEEEKEAIRTDAKVTWKLGSASCSGSGAQSPASSFEATEASYAGYKTIASRTMGSVAFTTFCPGTKLGTARQAGYYVRFSLTPKENTTFTPSYLSFDASRLGTNGGYIDAVWETPEGTSETICKQLNPARNDDYTSSVFDLSREGLSKTSGKGAMTLYLYNLGADKGIALANIVIGGQIDKTDALETLTDGSKSILKEEYFDLLGRPATIHTDGIILRRTYYTDGTVTIDRVMTTGAFKSEFHQ